MELFSPRGKKVVTPMSGLASKAEPDAQLAGHGSDSQRSYDVLATDGNAGRLRQ
jgi:hypothetical protein